MRTVLVAALIAGCGGGTTPAPATPQANGGDEQAIQASGFNDEGVAAMNAGDHAVASAHFRSAVARAPEARYFFNLCSSLFLEGKFSEALAACDAAGTHDPTPELVEKANTLVAKIHAEANAQGISMTGAPASAQAEIAAKLSEEGVQLMYAQKYADASAKFRDAVARAPEAKYFFNLCTSLFQEGKLSEALTSCASGKRSHPAAALATKLDAMIQRIRDEARKQNIPLEIH